MGVELSENDYSVELLYASNNGDGTVLLHSAGCGSPDYIFEGVGHVGLVKNAEVLAQIATIINSTYDNQVNLNMLSDDSVSLQTKQVTSKMISEKIIINEKGWIEGLDNRRIIIYAARDSIVYCEGKKITVKDEIAYDSNNNKVGSVWTLGSKNQRVYVLNNGNYSVSRTTKFKVEYINAGYYQQIVEYSISDNYHTLITIPDFSVFSTISNDVIDGVTVDVASVDEINQMNS